MGQSIHPAMFSIGQEDSQISAKKNVFTERIIECLYVIGRSFKENLINIGY